MATFCSRPDTALSVQTCSTLDDSTSNFIANDRHDHDAKRAAQCFEPDDEFDDSLVEQLGEGNEQCFIDESHARDIVMRAMAVKSASRVCAICVSSATPDP